MKNRKPNDDLMKFLSDSGNGNHLDDSRDSSFAFQNRHDRSNDYGMNLLDS